MPWWGDRGPAPHLEWPRRTIAFDAEWSEENGRWETHEGRYYFDADTADRACAFFPTFLTHGKGAVGRKPFVLLPYQAKLIVRPLLGWKDATTGLRRFRKLSAWLPKGSGKSPVGSGIGMWGLLCDGEFGAEVYAVAADKKQARVVHDAAKWMVRGNPELNGACEVTRDSIVRHETNSSYKVISADARYQHGFSPHVVILDEIHAQGTRDLFETLNQSMTKRLQSLLLILSHAGVDDEGIGAEEYEYAKEILSGRNVEDETCLPVIFEADPKEDWTDPKVWAATNPGFGVTNNSAEVKRLCIAAKAEPRKRNDFLRYQLNRWTNQAVAWLPIEWWDACPSGFDPAGVASLTCCAGLDLAQKIDLAAFVIAWREPLKIEQSVEVAIETPEGQTIRKELSLNYRLHVLPHFWIPEDTMAEHERQDRVPYSQWADRKWVTPTPGVTIDYDRILEDITALGERFPILKQAEIGYDPAFATDIANKLQARGFRPVETPQNHNHMNEPCHVLEALLKAGRVVNDGNRTMRWCVENVAVKSDGAGRIRPVKTRQSAKRIDGVVAMLMALGRLILMPDIAASSPYDRPGYVPMVF